MTHTPEFRSRARRVREAARLQLLMLRQARVARRGRHMPLQPTEPEALASNAPGVVPEAVELVAAPAPVYGAETEVEAVAETAPEMPPVAEPARPRKPKAAKKSAGKPAAPPVEAAKAPALRGPPPLPPVVPKDSAEDRSIRRAALAEMDCDDAAVLVTEPALRSLPAPQRDVSDHPLPEIGAALPSGPDEALTAETGPEDVLVAVTEEPAKPDVDSLGAPEPDIDEVAGGDAPQMAPEGAPEDVAERDAQAPEDGAADLPEAAESELLALPGAGPGLVWLLHRCGIRTLADLAAADPQQLAPQLGLVGQILNISIWTDFARGHVEAKRRAAS